MMPRNFNKHNRAFEIAYSGALSHRETRLFLYIFRHTIGWQKDHRQFRLSEIAAGTGMDREKARRTARSLIMRGFLLRRQVKDGPAHDVAGSTYQINPKVFHRVGADLAPGVGADLAPESNLEVGADLAPRVGADLAPHNSRRILRKKEKDPRSTTDRLKDLVTKTNLKAHQIEAISHEIARSQHHTIGSEANARAFVEILEKLSKAKSVNSPVAYCIAAARNLGKPYKEAV